MPTPITYADHGMSTVNDKVAPGILGYILNIAFRWFVVAKPQGYTLTVKDFCKVFTTRGGTANATFTLPTAASSGSGAWAIFFNAVDFNMVVAGTATEVITFNNAAATSLAAATAGELIGACILAVCDGTSWYLVPLMTETATITVA